MTCLVKAKQHGIALGAFTLVETDFKRGVEKRQETSKKWFGFQHNLSEFLLTEKQFSHSECIYPKIKHQQTYLLQTLPEIIVGGSSKGISCHVCLCFEASSITVNCTVWKKVTTFFDVSDVTVFKLMVGQLITVNNQR